jgi:2-amino-4-hydroxy-6-hydroxymethyldihydropteridine diphosphokinase
VARAGIGLGANLGDKAAAVESALLLLADEPGISLVARSQLYRTPPWGDTDQDHFINAAVLVETDLAPRDLLARCLGIEEKLGRERCKDRRWGPRSIDLDLIFYGDLRIVESDLEIPHPRLFERAFVLKPLAEIAPEQEIAGRRVDDALALLAEDAAAITVYCPA